MPELPEVEVTRRGVAPHVAGLRVERVEVRVPALRWPVPPNLPQLIEGSTLETVSRRGKYLLFEFPRGWMLVHLGMTGTLRIIEGQVPAEAGRHDHVDWRFAGLTMRLRDPRRFGAVLWHPREAGDVLLHPLLLGLGVEPLTPAFDAQMLFRATRGRKVSIKQLLLAGTVVVGVGNIYASEALFKARIRPTAPAGRISLARLSRLTQAIKDTLAAAITQGGSTLRDFANSAGESGYFQHAHLVYDRAGLPCTVCGTPIQQIVQGQRSTFFCPMCQR